MAHLWAPILPSLGPALLQEAQNAIDYSEKVVAGWLMKYMFNGQSDAEVKGNSVANYFSRGSDKKSHGRRIDREEARAQGVLIEDLESSQDLQEAVLTAYHLMTIVFEKSPAVKAIISERSKMSIKTLPCNRQWHGSGSRRACDSSPMPVHRPQLHHLPRVIPACYSNTLKYSSNR